MFNEELKKSVFLRLMCDSNLKRDRQSYSGIISISVDISSGDSRFNFVTNKNEATMKIWGTLLYIPEWVM